MGRERNGWWRLLLDAYAIPDFWKRGSVPGGFELLHKVKEYLKTWALTHLTLSQGALVTLGASVFAILKTLSALLNFLSFFYFTIFLFLVFLFPLSNHSQVPPQYICFVSPPSFYSFQIPPLFLSLHAVHVPSGGKSQCRRILTGAETALWAREISGKTHFSLCCNKAR